MALPVAPLEKPLAAVELPAWHYLYTPDLLYRWLEHIGSLTPTIVEGVFSVSAGEKGSVLLTLPPRICCVERVFEFSFDTSFGIRYGWKVDDPRTYTVPMHYFVPNRGYCEENIFGKNWIKWYYLILDYEAVNAGKVMVRAWARLMSHDDAERLLRLAEPLARMFNVTIPAKRAYIPPPASSELLKTCKVCGAKLLKTADGRIVRQGEWGVSYTSHECEVFK